MINLNSGGHSKSISHGSEFEENTNSSYGGPSCPRVYEEII
jgi:chromosome segregation ATPase